VHAWLHELIFERMNAGGIGTDKDSSTRSRLQAFLSDAMLSFEQAKCAAAMNSDTEHSRPWYKPSVGQKHCQHKLREVAARAKLQHLCRKLNETQFPFLWYQAMTIILVTFTIAFPFIAWIYVRHAVMSTLLAVMSVQTFAMMNEIANDIEDPFVHDAAIPFRPLQFRFNERLLAIRQTKRPRGIADYKSVHAVSTLQARTPQPSCMLRPCRCRRHPAHHAGINTSRWVGLV
jgi:hypothetical protein